MLGYVLHAPPISCATDPKQLTEDWALVDLNLDKIDWDTFKGNVLYLCSKISSAAFVLRMHPHPEGQSDLKYPLGGLLQVKGVVKEAELRSPKQPEAYSEERLLVVKTMGATIGRMTGIESVIREYDQYGLKKTSLEVAVYPYNHKDGAFSASGDSGSIVGLVTGDSGTTESTDLTYITPYFWLGEHVKKVFGLLGRGINAQRYRGRWRGVSILVLPLRMRLCDFVSFHHALFLPSRSFIYQFVVGTDVVDCCLGMRLVDMSSASLTT